MDRYLILGFNNYSGDYQGKPYSGVNVFVQALDVTPTAGIAVDRIKFKSSLLAKLPVCFTPDCVGCVLQLGYNRYGNISDAQIISGGGTS